MQIIQKPRMETVWKYGNHELELYGNHIEIVQKSRKEIVNGNHMEIAPQSLGSGHAATALSPRPRPASASLAKRRSCDHVASFPSRLAHRGDGDGEAAGGLDPGRYDLRHCGALHRHAGMRVTSSAARARGLAD